METVCMIPARLESTRLPRKVLCDLAGLPVLQRVYDNVVSMQLFDSVIIVTDSDEIRTFCKQIDAPVQMTAKEHRSGTSRIAEAIQSIDAKHVVNIQGDEPFIKKSQIERVIQALKEPDASPVATLVHPTSKGELAEDPNRVKAVLDLKDRALYFSRYPLPYRRDGEVQVPWHIHLGVYGFQRDFLNAYPNLIPSPVETAEQLEQLRFIANGYAIHCLATDTLTQSIDTAADLEEAVAYYQENKQKSDGAN